MKKIIAVSAVVLSVGTGRLGIGFGAEASGGNTAIGTLAIPIGHWLLPNIFPTVPGDEDSTDPLLNPSNSDD